VRPIHDLVNVERPALPALMAMASAAGDRATVLPVESARAEDVLLRLQVTVAGALGALASLAPTGSSRCPVRPSNRRWCRSRRARRRRWCDQDLERDCFSHGNAESPRPNGRGLAYVLGQGCGNTASMRGPFEVQ